MATTQTIAEMKAQIAAMAADDEEFRARLLKDPKPTINEALGTEVPDFFNIQIHEDTGTTAHLILSPTDRLTDQELQMAAGGSDWIEMQGDVFGQ